MLFQAGRLVVSQHPFLEEAEETRDLALCLGVARQVGKELDIQLPQGTPYLRLYQPLQRLLAVGVEATVLVAGKAELGVIVRVEDPWAAVELHGLTESKEGVVSGIAGKDAGGHHRPGVVVQDGHHTDATGALQPRAHGGVHLPKLPEGAHLEAARGPALAGARR